MSKRRHNPRPKKARTALAVEFSPPPPPDGPFPLTMQEEMALAIILWRAVRFSYQNDRILSRNKGQNKSVIVGTPRSPEQVNDTAIEMAKRMGVKEEFFEWLWKFPVFKLYLAGLDPWPDTVKGIVPPDREAVTVVPPRISYLRSDK